MFKTNVRPEAMKPGHSQIVFTKSHAQRYSLVIPGWEMEVYSTFYVVVLFGWPSS